MPLTMEPIIAGIVEDGNENIWVTTARGITNVIPAVDLKTGRYIFQDVYKRQVF